MVNFGARRLRASGLAGKTTIPACVDHQHTDYQQVIENVQRDNLKPRELALFIKKKLDEGEKQVQIAAQLGVDRSTITHHLALIEPPSCLEELYSSGTCQSAKILYDLRGLHKQFPQAVERFCKQTEEVTRIHVANLKRLPSKRTHIAHAASLATENGGDEATGSTVLSPPTMTDGRSGGGGQPDHPSSARCPDCLSLDTRSSRSVCHAHDRHACHHRMERRHTHGSSCQRLSD